jgi:Ca2+-binding EF-hand superfamily protein
MGCKYSIFSVTDDEINAAIARLAAATPEKLAALKEEFEEMDIDKDGFLTETDAKDAITLKGLKQIMAVADINVDSKISLAEFTLFSLALEDKEATKVSARFRCRHIFIVADKDKDEMLSPRELQEALKIAGHTLTPEQIQKRYKKIFEEPPMLVSSKTHSKTDAPMSGTRNTRPSTPAAPVAVPAAVAAANAAMEAKAKAKAAATTSTTPAAGAGAGAGAGTGASSSTSTSSGASATTVDASGAVVSSNPTAQGTQADPNLRAQGGVERFAVESEKKREPNYFQVKWKDYREWRKLLTLKEFEDFMLM